MTRIFSIATLLLGITSGFASLPTLQDAIAGPRDVWGDAAMRQPNGASYEFFAPLLPPLRYVHADFRDYPLVLSAPEAKAKARLISNGNGVNLRGGSRSWKEVGTPVVFRVGVDEFLFGGLRDRVSDPKPADGWLPIYEITYLHPSPVQAEGLVPIDQKPVRVEPEVYRLEAFVSTDPALADNAVVFVRFSLSAGARGVVSVALDPTGEGSFAAGKISDRNGKEIVHLDNAWKWERQGARATFTAGSVVTLAIATRPLDGFKFDATSYEQHRAVTVKTWQEIVARAARVDVPELLVNNAWRNLLVQNFMLLSGNRMLYSAGNQYESLYEAEGSDAALAMMSWGYEPEALQMMGPLLAYLRKGLEYHQAGLKLNNVIRYWWQTRDRAGVESMRSAWTLEMERILAHRTNANGLLPKERYCGDISTPVHSLSVDAQAWRSLHDLPAMLNAIGNPDLARRVAAEARSYKTNLDDAVMRSVHREVTPPFVPIALLANESVHKPITATRIGSYWNLIIGYVIGSRIFPHGSTEAGWLPHYLEHHGGLCMGMTRAGGTEHAFWTGAERINPLYGSRYVVDALRRDDPERALVSFYGMLAHGFTRGTFVAGEGSTLAPVDAAGRFFYCPPNSAGNAHFLTVLRTLLVQDLDLDDDGEPETLRLGFGTSRRWLEDGNHISVERMPTAFGPVSTWWESRLAAGEVLARVDLPGRNMPVRIFLRARVPEPWRVSNAAAAGQILPMDAQGTVELTGCTGLVEVRFQVAK